MLHGGFGSWTHWVANIGALQKSRTLWVPDIPGLGASAGLDEPSTVEHFAREVLTSLDTLFGADSDFDLAGFSFGALIGAQLAAMAGERCKHLLVCGAAGFGDLHRQVDLLRPPGADTPVDEAIRIHRANLRTLMFAREETIDDLSIHVHGDNLSRARFNSRRLARSNAFVDALPNISARLCGIWGSEDATAGGLAAIEQRRALFLNSQPGSSFHILEGIGHWAMYEDAGTFNRIVVEELIG
jgi:pimeloyl-ACP methyl ester carboxylesterase